MTLDNLQDLSIFAKVVATGSQSAAARELDVSLAVVSKRLALLEKQLGVRLLNRTTRQQSLTEEGQLFYASCVRILAEVSEAETQLLLHRDSVSGVLRINAPNAFGRRHLVPLVTAFQARHPQLRVQLDLTDAVIDLVEGGVDVAIRFGSLPDSSLFARELAPNYRVLCASPDYIARRGLPQSAAELVQHDCILFGEQLVTEWQFHDESIKVHGNIVTNHGEAAHELALCGAGIVLKSIWDVGADLDSGQLIRVLPEHAIASAPLHAVYLHSRHLAPRVRQFVAFVSEQLQQAWRWDPAPKLRVTASGQNRRARVSGI
ncbi:LysR substrate-binding domain-containing protein [Silvimonas sp.]|uniref:LysR family transcriptional regulator n=1 Tax=Silvimonas sp. TaxID=2650811 RepID=UPI0028403EC8|nr:LysR substrate-binding domain-containing protein [Silvimonas sp.]MDR3428309.1 LysR substrate-binding domain-containing protein [Silvimonas sp.]